jgi:hypothetical protein
VLCADISILCNAWRRHGYVKNPTIISARLMPCANAWPQIISCRNVADINFDSLEADLSVAVADFSGDELDDFLQVDVVERKMRPPDAEVLYCAETILPLGFGLARTKCFGKSILALVH